MDNIGKAHDMLVEATYKYCDLMKFEYEDILICSHIKEYHGDRTYVIEINIAMPNNNNMKGNKNAIKKRKK